MFTVLGIGKNLTGKLETILVLLAFITSLHKQGRRGQVIMTGIKNISDRKTQLHTISNYPPQLS